MKFRLLLTATLLLVSASLAAAQAMPGLPAWDTYAGGKQDSIDLSSLDLNITIPMLHKKGIGLDVSIPWMLGSFDWERYGPAWELSNSWTGIPVEVGSVSETTTVAQCQNAQGIQYNYNVYDAYVYMDGSRVSHAVVADAAGDDLVTEDPYPCGGDGPYPTSATGITRDGSGLSIEVSGEQMISVTTASGTVFTRTGGVTFPLSGTITDRNGNTITLASHVQIPGYNTVTTTTDTLGVAAFSESPAGIGSLISTYSYPNPAGGTSTYTLTDQYLYIQTAFGCPGVPEYYSYDYFPSELQLPDGTAYHFTYEHTPGYASNYTTGRITSMTLPTGAVITYTYPGANDDINCSTGGTVEIERTAPDGITTYVRSGNVTTVTGAGNQTVVSDQRNASWQ